MNIMVRDALGIMITEGLYYEGENYRKLMDELYEYSCSLAESGDDYDTVMASAGKKYDVMPARYPKEMVLAALAEQLKPMYDSVGAGIDATIFDGDRSNSCFVIDYSSSASSNITISDSESIISEGYITYQNDDFIYTIYQPDNQILAGMNGQLFIQDNDFRQVMIYQDDDSFFVKRL